MMSSGVLQDGEQSWPYLEQALPLAQACLPGATVVDECHGDVHGPYSDAEQPQGLHAEVCSATSASCILLHKGLPDLEI